MRSVHPNGGSYSAKDRSKIYKRDSVWLSYSIPSSALLPH